MMMMMMVICDSSWIPYCFLYTRSYWTARVNRAIGFSAYRTARVLVFVVKKLRACGVKELGISDEALHHGQTVEARQGWIDLHIRHLTGQHISSSDVIRLLYLSWPSHLICISGTGYAHTHMAPTKSCLGLRPSAKDTHLSLSGRITKTPIIWISPDTEVLGKYPYLTPKQALYLICLYSRDSDRDRSEMITG